MIRWPLALIALASSVAAMAAYEPAPWLADLAQMRAALESDYANLEWLAERGPIEARFERAAQRIKMADSDAAARRAIERLLERFHDGHVEISWPAAKAAAAAAELPRDAGPATATSLCRRLGYGGFEPYAGSVAKLPGYAPLPAGPIPAGTIRSGETTVGAITIGVFMPQGYPTVCEGAVAALKLPFNQPCDDKCADAVITRAYGDLTAAIAARIAALRAAGATTLLVDVTGNGGGSEWAEAVARMFTAAPLKPATWGIVRTPAWARQWTATANSLTTAAAKARGAERQFLTGQAARARGLAVESARVCGPGKDCPRLATGGYATGMLAAPPPMAIADEAAAAALWSPAQYAAPAGVWRGPLIVLTDSETWSAAEELAATLQDNRAAVVLGGRTGGAGCGHASGGEPVLLKNSGGTLKLPDCARFRFDGSNEVAGVIPDVNTGHRADDGDALKARLIAAKLPEAIALARRLQP